MSDLTVIYDSTLEIGAIVDLDTNMAWGPICPGPRGAELLQAFVDGMPFDITILSEEQARDIFLSVFREDATQSIANAGKDSASTMDESPNPTTNDETLATSEAVAANGAPPEPQPADADMAADQSQADTVTPAGEAVEPTPTPVQPPTPAPVETPQTTNCLICNAQGTGSNNPGCPVCGGTGKVAATA